MQQALRACLSEEMGPLFVASLLSVLVMLAGA
jgi:hypothetical protein